MDLFEKCSTDGGYFGYFRSRNDHYFTQPVLDPLPGTRTIFNGKKCVQWSINNYLGLAEDGELRQVAIESAGKYSASAPMGSRMMSGNTLFHMGLEQKFADFLQKESGILFGCGYLGVLGTLSSLVQKDDTILIDRLSHASMLDGTLLASGTFRVFKHNDMESLERHLKHSNRHRKGGVLIVTEGVFSMRGDLANLKDICSLKEQYGARLFIDDAHGFGVMGEHGQGTASHWGVHDKVDIYFGTLSKAFASIGGIATGEERVINWIRYNARTQIFTKSLPMICVDVIAKALEKVRTEDERRNRLFENSKKLRNGLTGLGFSVGDVPSPIIPVYVPAGDTDIAMRIIASLRESGIFITGVMYPVVPKGVVLLRMIPTASHTDEDIAQTVAAFRKVRDALRLDLEVAALK